MCFIFVTYKSTAVLSGAQKILPGLQADDIKSVLRKTEKQWLLSYKSLWYHNTTHYGYLGKFVRHCLQSPLPVDPSGTLLVVGELFFTQRKYRITWDGT